MNEKMKKLLAQIDAKRAMAKSFLDGEEKDVSKATSLLDEADDLVKEYEAEKRLFESQKEEVAKTAIPQIEAKKDADGYDAAAKSLASAARRGFKGLSEGAPENGGYTVPEAIETKVRELKEAKASLRDFVHVIPVKTNSGALTLKKRSQKKGFTKVGEGAAIGASGAPTFDRVEWMVEKYGGYLPVTTELLEDSDANIAATVQEWLADEGRVTENRLIVEKLNTKPAVAIASVDDIKRILNVTLGQAFKPTSVVHTNDDGLQWLDTLKDKDGDYLLTARPDDPMKMVLAAGATKVPVNVVPNEDLPSESTYAKTGDESVVPGKAYFTESDGKYIPVEDPQQGELTNYYEVTGQVIPMYIGDLYEGIKLFDRRMITLKQSDVASIGEVNAFEDDLVIFRGTMREDVEPFDDGAWVRGSVTVTEAVG